MPNWCANRLRVTGPEEEVSKVRALMEGSAEAPGYVRAAGEGIQFFLAGCADLLRPTAATEYAPYPALTETAGSDTPENRAFTQWLELLRSGAELTPEICERQHDLWLASGLQRMTWATLTVEQQTMISALWEKKKGDWHWTINGQALIAKCDGLCLEEALPLRTLPFDMLQLLPPRLDAESTAITAACLKASRTDLRTPSTVAARSGHTRTTLTCRIPAKRYLTPTLIRPGRYPRRRCCAP